MKLKDCYISLVDGFQIIQVKEFEKVSEHSVLLKKVRLVGGGSFGIRKHFKRFTLLIEESPQTVEDRLRSWSVTPIFGKKIVPVSKESYGSDLALQNTGTSFFSLYTDMKLLLRAYKDLMRISKRDVQVAKFLEVPAFKRVQLEFANLERMSEVLGQKIKPFGASYSLREPTMGEEVE